MTDSVLVADRLWAGLQRDGGWADTALVLPASVAMAATRVAGSTGFGACTWKPEANARPRSSTARVSTWTLYGSVTRFSNC